MIEKDALGLEHFFVPNPHSLRSLDAATAKGRIHLDQYV
jgi:hypothetical protein